MSKLGLSGDTVVIQTVGTGSSKHIRITTPILTNDANNPKAGQQYKVTSALQARFGTSPSVNQVGATWGKEITKKAIEALIVFLIVVVIYLSFRFQPKMALAAILALLHDLLITAGIYSLVGFEVSPATVVALLTILGYSLYDTVVVFDKVRENTMGIGAGSRMTYSQAANLAVDQTVVRSMNTSIIALLPVAGLLFIGVGLLGAGTLKDLSLALFIGLATGAYSSIFIATPLLCDLKEREPAMVALRKKVAMREAAEAKAAREGTSTAEAAATQPVDGSPGGESGTSGEAAAAAVVAGTAAASATRPPVRRKPASRPGTKRRR
jgi:preprotein translocase subunit SecF